MVSLRFVLAALFSLVLVACGESHTTGDGGRSDGSSGGCVGPAPTGCVERGPGFCCDSVPAECVDGSWDCDVPGPLTGSCEGPCGGEMCSGPAPLCYRDLGDGCCGEETPPVCFTPAYGCEAGSVNAGECTGFSPDCGTTTACTGLTESECVGSPECSPLYDDFCCPTCTPIGACADCLQLQMHRCGPADEVCGGGACGTVDAAHCIGEVSSCSDANPTAGWRCDRTGCVAAVMAGCSEDCPRECVAVRGDMCEALCDGPSPDCPTGTVPETDGFCYTGRCIGASACEPASVPAP